MILILGANGYVGSAFKELLKSSNRAFKGFSRAEIDYTQLETLKEILEETKPEFLINAAGYTGKPNVDACETNKADCLNGNALLPGTIKKACETFDISWGHVSSGCIYTGDRDGGGGFTEECTPNFSFRTNNCSFYSGTKALGEELLVDAQKCYIWRLRIPFNHESSPRNYLNKLITYKSLLEAKNSISHLEEFVAACVSCFEKEVPFGTYNLTNPGYITTREVTQLMIQEGKRRESKGQKNPFPKDFNFFEDEHDFMKKAANTPRSNCIMNTSKMEKAGIFMNPVQVALENSLKNWKST